MEDDTPKRRAAPRPFHHPSRIWVAMLMCYASWALLVLSIILLGLLFIDGDREMGKWGMIAFAGYVILCGARYLQSEAIKCPLCHGPTLHNKKCRKHANARRHFFFSHRVSIMIDLLIHRWFHCMYCGTPFRLKQR